MGPQEPAPKQLRPLRWILAALFAAALVITSAGFEPLGADCGDAINKDGTETFTCNGPAYLLMAVGLIALVGLAAVGLWAALDWHTARRARRPQ